MISFDDVGILGMLKNCFTIFHQQKCSILCFNVYFSVSHISITVVCKLKINDRDLVSRK